LPGAFALYCGLFCALICLIVLKRQICQEYMFTFPRKEKHYFKKKKKKEKL
jgi:hypothetical protein